MESYLQSKRKFILGILLVFVLGATVTSIFGIVLSLVQTSTTISSGGLVKGIGVGIYWNSACTNKTSTINWGLLDPGSNKTLTVYVRNEGNTVATLSKTTGNWNPATASSYFSLNWNYAGQTLSVNQVLQIKLTLAVLSTVSGITNFSFDITIIAVG